MKLNKKMLYFMGTLATGSSSVAMEENHNKPQDNPENQLEGHLDSCFADSGEIMGIIGENSLFLRKKCNSGVLDDTYCPVDLTKNLMEYVLQLRTACPELFSERTYSLKTEEAEPIKSVMTVSAEETYKKSMEEIFLNAKKVLEEKIKQLNNSTEAILEVSNNSICTFSVVDNTPSWTMTVNAIDTNGDGKTDMAHFMDHAYGSFNLFSITKESGEIFASNKNIYGAIYEIVLKIKKQCPFFFQNKK